MFSDLANQKNDNQLKSLEVLSNQALRRAHMQRSGSIRQSHRSQASGAISPTTRLTKSSVKSSLRIPMASWPTAMSLCRC